MQIEQIDRDAAAEEVYEREKGNLAWPYAKSTCDRILSGDWDHHPTVQRYARHRLAAITARPADSNMVEMAASCVDEAALSEAVDLLWRFDPDSHSSVDCVLAIASTIAGQRFHRRNEKARQTS